MAKGYSRRKMIAQGLMGTSALAFSACRKEGGADSKDKQADEFALAGQNRKFIFVFTAMGGASINDSFMAVRRSESKSADTLNTYPDAQVYEAEGTNLRAVDIDYEEVGPLPFEVKGVQSRFLAKYANDIMVTPVAGTSVAHRTGQYRSVTGHDAWNGRTLQEAVAQQYGQGLLLPNVNMSSVGYALDGTDASLSDFARALHVADPLSLPFGLDGVRGLPGAPTSKLVDIARRFRNTTLEPMNPGFANSQNHPRVQQWMAHRELRKQFEAKNLINKLIPFDDTDYPFTDFGLTVNPNVAQYKEMFPQLGPDVLQNQALMAYLLVTSGLTCAVTFGLGMNVTIDGEDEGNEKLTNTPTGFDYSHNAHRSTQALLWSRTLDNIDRLITMLKATEYRAGQSYWDHSLIYIATEFGRDKDRDANLNEFPTGHHTNNAVAMISPLVNGGKALGGVDPDTLLTYGFDPVTGQPTPGKTMRERDIYAGILQSMNVDIGGSGLPTMTAMKRGGGKV